MIRSTRNTHAAARGPARASGVSWTLALAAFMVVFMPARPSAAGPVPQVEPSAIAAPQDEEGDDGHFAINLASYLDPITIADLPPFDVPAGMQLYISDFVKGGKHWYRARLGLFANRAEAKSVMQALSDVYPQAWLTRVSEAEWIRLKMSQPPSLPAPQPSAGSTGKDAAARRAEADAATAKAEAETRRLLDQAASALQTNNLDRAIALYTKALSLPANSLQTTARELLGLARERNNQLAHAKAQYQTYLSEYPDAEGAPRVRQRLDGLLSASKPDQKRLRPGKRGTVGPSWDVSGGWSQFYRRNARVSAPGGGDVDGSTLSTDLNLTGRVRSQAYDIRAQLTGGRDQDFLDADDSEIQLNDMYFDANQKHWGAGARLGRQTRSSGGVLGRFDGAAMGYDLTERTRVSFVGGLPVQRLSPGDIDTSKYFYGLGVELGPYFERLEFDTYAIEQRVEGMIDRRAAGGEARYLDASRSVFGAVDYDVFYLKLNTALVLANWTLKNFSTLNASFDYRTTPVLTTSNALQGQLSDSIAELRRTFTDDEIRALAEDRTTVSRTFTVGASRPMTDKLLVSGQFTMANLSGTEASGGVEAMESTGNQFFYNGQIVGSNLLKPGDITSLGLRYGDTSNSDFVSLNVNTRYPFSRMLRFSPKVVFDYRFANGGQTIVRPSSRIEFSWRRSIQLELELGGEWLRDKTPIGTDDTLGYFLNAGYRWDF